MFEFSPQPRLKLSRLRDIGWEIWDPIGLLLAGSKWSDDANKPFADEYDRYMTSAASQLRQGAPLEIVIDYLVKIEAQHMGMGEGPTTKKRAEAVVSAVLADQEIWTWPDEQGRFA
ncbi:MAG: hypothetical protein CFE33_01255 [Pseudorhodobacter sp. PARRP1]|nr:MAG: hypothetical protein CFE33_01255 [Pseudorhodobacter sp. PARRP1]